MAFSCLENFIHFPATSFSISNSNSNSNNLNTSVSPPLSANSRRASLRVRCHGGAEPEKKEDPLETIDKLYREIKDKADIADAIAHQRLNPLLLVFRTNSKVSKLVSNTIWALQNSLVFSVQPTTKDGSMVGIKWKVGWNKPLIKSEKGLTIHSYHSYVGKLFIGNFETLMDPLLRLEPMRMMNWSEKSKSKERRVASLCLGGFLLLVSLFFFQFSVG